jgi:DNA-directed RNA polymerase subunit RPC12/RpoP
MDMEDILRLTVFLETEEKGKCSSCGREFNLLEEFKEDSLALKEYTLSHLCKDCQDQLFKIQ